MGALSPVLTGLSAITTAISAVDRAVNVFSNASRDDSAARASALRAQQDLALKQLQQKQQADERTAQEQAAQERERVAAAADAAENQRRAALRRAVARQRAQFGAQGIAADDGSAEAVLLGLFDESDQDRADRERLDTIRTAALDQDIATQGRINVLQRQQLIERQNLQRIVENY